jgi:hypothetical protein
MPARDKVVNQLTSYLKGLSNRRNSGTVTADDAQKFLNRVGFTGNTVERLSVVRSALNESNFYAIGTVPSSRPVARGRRVTAWTY